MWQNKRVSGLEEANQEDCSKSKHSSMQSKESQRLCQIHIYVLIIPYQWQTAKSRIYHFSGVYVLDLAVWC